MDWVQLFSDIEDSLFPHFHLSVWERAVYYHLLRNSRVVDQQTVRRSLSQIAVALEISDFKVRDVVRSLNQKGCVEITNRSRTGHTVRVLLPSELNLPVASEDPPVSIDEIDFFAGRGYVVPLLARESGRCFYCLREVTQETCELDHVSPLASAKDNSFRNIVVSCHECNKLKQDMAADQHLRQLLRSSLLSETEFQERLAAIEALKRGELAPEL